MRALERIRGPGSLVAVAAFAFAACLRKINDADYWTHLAFGRAYVAAGTLGLGDPFVSGRDATVSPWSLSHAWGALVHGTEWPFQLAVHAVERTFGHAGVSVAVALCAAAAAALLAAPLLRPARISRTAAVVVFAAAALSLARFRFSPRPEAVAAVFLGGLLLLAYDWGRRPRWGVLAGVAAILLAWHPLHPTWTLGAALAGVMILAAPRLDFWRARPLAVRIVAAIAALAFVGGAARFALFVLRGLASGGVLEAVTEMRPAWEFPSVFVPFVAVSAAGALLAWGRPEGRAPRLAVWALAVVLGAVVVRNVAFAVLAMIPGAALGAEPSAEGEPRGRRVLASAAAALGLVALGVIVARDRENPAGLGVDWRQFPRGAAAFVRSGGLEAPVFNTWGWGGYLAWEWNGAPRTFLDGRLGTPDQLAASDAIEDGDPAPVIARHGFRTVLLDPVYSSSGRIVPGVWWFLASPEWRLVSASDALVFARVPLPAGVSALPPAAAWPVVLRRADLALEQRDVPPHAEYTRAIAWLALGEMAAAREALERGRRVSPGLAGAYVQVDHVLSRAGR
jgi:hypothetical protein